MKTTLATAALTLAAALAAAPALASPDRAGPRAMLEALNFAELDADADGAITLAEWRAGLTARMEARRTERSETRVAALMAGDSDGDGLLSAEELAARLGALADERRAARAERRDDDRRGWGRHHEGRHEGRQGGWREGRGEHGRMGGGDPEQAAVRSFQRIDRDGDGRITQAEFDRAVQWMQDRMERRGRDRG